MSLLSDLVILLILIVAFLAIIALGVPSSGFVSLFNTTSSALPNSTTTAIGSNSTTTYQQSQLASYALSLINNDRAKYGLAPVTLSATQSAQQHADSMLQYNYFSHWDIYGMKPYMRYTQFGGTGAVSENIAYEKSSACRLVFCYGNIDVNKSLQQMEYSMMYNDSACCNNGHRDNILDPNHSQVSIGIAYNSSAIYFVEDFIDSYISWSNSPAFSDSEVYLQGTLASSYGISSVTVSYDDPVQAMTTQQLSQTGDYSYGQQVAGVVSSPLYHYKGITTIVAGTYQTNGNSFNIDFNMRNLIGQYGAGEYTVLVWLNNGTGASNSSFVGSSYTLFINASGQEYFPRNV